MKQLIIVPPGADRLELTPSTPGNDLRVVRCPDGIDVYEDTPGNDPDSSRWLAFVPTSWGIINGD